MTIHQCDNCKQVTEVHPRPYNGSVIIEYTCPRCDKKIKEVVEEVTE